jgi:high-affinity iron transporter
MDFTAALPTFVITLREGVEAALVVGIVLSYLKKADQTRLNAWVLAGIVVGILASIWVGIGFNQLFFVLETSNQEYAAVIKQLLESMFGVVAIALLSWMLVWMTRQARSIKAQVEGTITTALQESDRAGWAIFSLIMIAVLREGFETVIFIAAKFQQGWIPALGAFAGLLVATGIGVLLFQLGIKINIRRFFQMMGILLLLIVSGLVVSSLRHVDATVYALAQVDPVFAPFCPDTHSSCILGPLVWNASHVLPDRQFPGILLKALFGYTQTLYLAQAIGYLLFLGIVGGIYLQSITGWKVPKLGRASSDNMQIKPPINSDS